MSKKAAKSMAIAPVYFAQFFSYNVFEHCSKKLPIMLNIMPITTAIMPQFVYNFIILITIIAYVVRVQTVMSLFLLIMIGCSALIFDVLCSNYAHEETCASFCTNLWVITASQTFL